MSDASSPDAASDRPRPGGRPGRRHRDPRGARRVPRRPDRPGRAPGRPGRVRSRRWPSTVADLDGLSPEDAAQIAGVARAMLLQAASFAADPGGAAPTWSVNDPALLTSLGEASAAFAPLIRDQLAPQLDGLADALRARRDDPRRRGGRRRARDRVRPDVPDRVRRRHRHLGAVARALPGQRRGRRARRARSTSGSRTSRPWPTRIATTSSGSRGRSSRRRCSAMRSSGAGRRSRTGAG